MSFLKIFRRPAIVGAASLLLLAPVAASAGEFTPAQKKELGGIIREYLLQNPEVLRDAFQELERRSRVAEAQKSKKAIAENAAAIFRSEDDLVAGNREGKVTMVEYFDYNCGFCKRSFPDVMKLLDKDKDLRIVFKEFPILGPGSTFASRAALASREQGKYWEFHLALMSARGAVTEARVLKIAAKIGLDVDKLKADMKSPKIKAIIERNMATAQALGIQGTPAFLIDDKLIPGAVGYQSLAGTISSVRENGGCKVC